MKKRQDLAATPEPGDEDIPADAEPCYVTGRRAPGKKNTRDWCLGKVGREHLTAIHRPVNTGIHQCRWEPCDWTRLPNGGFQARAWTYLCGHVEMCVACGKVIRPRPRWSRSPIRGRLSVVECPDYGPPPPEAPPIRYPKR